MRESQTAVVTGASSGLGYAISIQLAKVGAHIYIIDRNKEGLAKTSKAIRDLGGTAIEVCGDVCDTSTWEYFAQVLRREERIDFLFNSAGVGAAGAIDELDIDVWQRTMNVNFLGTVQGCRTVVPLMKRQRCGAIVNIASRAAISCAPNMGPYNASKAAVVALSETLHSELESFGVSVTVACPSYFKTSIANSMYAANEKQRVLAKKFVEGSRISAEKMASMILAAASSKTLHYFPPGEDRFLWRFKRFFPKKCLGFVRRKYIQEVSSI